MNPNEDHTQTFDRVVALNEAVKALVERSFKIEILALDAMVRSKRGGGNLRGFDEVSSQMRAWSRDLGVQLTALGVLSHEVVAATSMALKEGRIVRLLGAAVSSSNNEDARAIYTQRRAEQDGREREVSRDWRRMRDMIGDLDQLGMMAVVLSRSAMIEATSGDSGQRDQLGQVSKEFYESSEIVVTVLKGLLKVMGTR